MFTFHQNEYKEINKTNKDMETKLISLVEKALPAMSGSQVTYSQRSNIFLSSGYTSAAGNTYFQGIRLSDRIIINYDFGQGWKYLFLNGIRIYGYDGRNKQLISSKSYNCTVFSEQFAKVQCQKMIIEYLSGQMKLMGNTSVTQSQLSEFSSKIVAEALRNNPQKLLA